MSADSLLLDRRDTSAVDAQMRAYLRAFTTVVVPGAIVSLALCLTMLTSVLA